MIPTSYYQPPHSARQYAAYANDPSNQVQTYSHGETGNHPHPQQQQPSSSAVPTAPEVPSSQPHGVFYATPSSTPAPHRAQSPSSEFSIVKSVEPQVFYSPDNHLGSAQAIQFSHSPAKPAIQIHQETQTTYPSLTHPNNGILNYLGVHNKQPTSLLDSYVPSSLQLSPIKHFSYPTKSTPIYRPYNPHYNHHHHQSTHFQPQLFYQPTYPVSHSTYPIYPTHTPPQQVQQVIPSPAPTAHQLPAVPSYNTIAYSVPLSHTKTVTQFKRSPALETVAGVKFSQPRSLSSRSFHNGGAITTKLHPAAKLH